MLKKSAKFGLMQAIKYMIAQSAVIIADILQNRGILSYFALTGCHFDCSSGGSEAYSLADIEYTVLFELGLFWFCIDYFNPYFSIWFLLCQSSNLSIVQMLIAYLGEALKKSFELLLRKEWAESNYTRAEHDGK